MNWYRQHRVANWLRYRTWPFPLVGIVAGIGVLRVVRVIDEQQPFPWFNYGEEGARALASTLSAAMLTFIVFVFSILLLVVQLASAQLTPRVIPKVFNDKTLKFTLAMMTFTFAYCVGVLARVDDRVPELCMAGAAVSSFICLVAFFILFDRVGKLLRPATILAEVATEACQVIHQVYPNLASELEHEENSSNVTFESVRTVPAPRRSGVLQGFDFAGLLAFAKTQDCVIELSPQVGDFVPPHAPMLRLSKPLEHVSDEEMLRYVALGTERTIEQDPAFSLRILVDIANKALSPAINDPTTAVLALDQLHFLLREIGQRHLDPGTITDEARRMRLVFRTPDWPHYVSLAMTEIRQFGATSVQILRRQRALLNDLLATLPESRHSALFEELRLLESTTSKNFADITERRMAGESDTQGIGASPSPRV